MGQAVLQHEMLARRGEWKRTGEGVVCVYGAFDLLHPGHVRLLEQARDFAEILTVAVQSDELVRSAATSVRGGDASETDASEERPITPASERAEILAALKAVDFSAVVNQPFAEFLRRFRPDVLVCGDEPGSPFAYIGANAGESLEHWLAGIGCRLIRLALEPGYSTSRIIERISGRRA